MSAERINTKPCRRCEECIGQEHHFLGIADFDEGSDEWFYPCKHCDARLDAEEEDERSDAEDSEADA